MMIAIYGMNDVLEMFLSETVLRHLPKPYSDKTAELIDAEVRNLINDVYARTKQLLLDKREGLIKIAEKLLEKEILFQSDLEEILGKRPFETKTTYEEFVNGADGGGVPQTDLPLDVHPDVKRDLAKGRAQKHRQII
jgi:cell division protease FtsH